MEDTVVVEKPSGRELARRVVELNESAGQQKLPGTVLSSLLPAGAVQASRRHPPNNPIPSNAAQPDELVVVVESNQQENKACSKQHTPTRQPRNNSVPSNPP